MLAYADVNVYCEFIILYVIILRFGSISVKICLNLIYFFFVTQLWLAGFDKKYFSLEIVLLVLLIET